MSAAQISSGDRETVHLFSVDLPEDALWDFVTADPETGAFPLRDALGVESLEETAVEGAVAEDLAGIGLTGFLTEGIGIDASQIAPDRAKVDALQGSVVIVRGTAFDRAEVPMTPRAPLTHVGTWRMTPAPTTMESLRSDAAKGTLPPTDPAPVPAAPRTRRMAWLLGALIVFALLALLIGAL